MVAIYVATYNTDNNYITNDYIIILILLLFLLCIPMYIYYIKNVYEHNSSTIFQLIKQRNIIRCKYSIIMCRDLVVLSI